MLSRSDVAIVIPAFNEESDIETIILEVSKYGYPIVVDDGSSDETGALAEGAGATLLRHEANQGYDSALNTGFAHANSAGFSYIITFDVDGDSNIKALGSFVHHLKNGYDLVLGERPKFGRFSENLFAFYSKLRFGLRDPLCGMKGYRTSLYKMLGCFDSYKSIGTQLALYGITRNKNIIQVPVNDQKREGASRFGEGWKPNYKILRSMFLSFFKT